MPVKIVILWKGAWKKFLVYSSISQDYFHTRLSHHNNCNSKNGLIPRIKFSDLKKQWKTRIQRPGLDYACHTQERRKQNSIIFKFKNRKLPPQILNLSPCFLTYTETATVFFGFVFFFPINPILGRILDARTCFSLLEQENNAINILTIFSKYNFHCSYFRFLWFVYTIIKIRGNKQASKQAQAFRGELLYHFTINIADNTFPESIPRSGKSFFFISFFLFFFFFNFFFPLYMLCLRF